MSRITDWLWGTTPEQTGPESSTAPQVRSDEPVLPTPDANEALIVPTRGDWKYSVSEGEALSLISVYRASQVISTSVMQLTLDAIKDDQQVDPKPLILRRPDADESLTVFLEKTTLCLTLNGNAFWQIFRDNQGRVTGLRVLNPHDVVIQVDSFGTVTGYKYSRREQPFTKTEVKHLSLMRVPGDPRGKGPIQAAQAELRGALDTRNYSANWFQDAAVPTGILSAKTSLSPEAAEVAKERWVASQGGQRGPAILGGDWSYQSVYLSPEDAQFIAVRQFDKTAVATLFGIPAHLMHAAIEGCSQTFSNVQQAWVEFNKFTLIRYTREIEEAFSDLLPRGTEARFNLSGLLRADDQSRWAVYTQALTAGVLSKNEVRAHENLTPIPGGDHPTQAELDAAAAQFEQTPAEDEPADETEQEAGE